MEKKKSNTLVSAVIIGGITAVLHFLLGSVLSEAVLAFSSAGITLIFPLYFVLLAITGFLAMALAEILYVKGVVKTKLPKGAFIISSVVAAAVVILTSQLPRLIHHNISSIIYLVIVIRFVLYSIIALLFVKTAGSRQGEPYHTL